MPVSTSSSSWPTGTRSSPLALTRCGTAWVQGSYEVLFGAPNANGIAERWVRTVRSGCADRLLIVNEGHLRRVLDRYVRHYNQHRPHRGLAMDAPVPRGNTASPTPARITRIRQHEVLAGLINESHAARAARTSFRTLRGRSVGSPSARPRAHRCGPSTRDEARRLDHPERRRASRVAPRPRP